MSSTTTILHLNDDVLEESFKHLSDLELSTMADVCTTFRANAMAEFLRRYKSKRFFCYTGVEVKDLYHILRNFGPCVNSLEVAVWRNFHRSKLAMEIIAQFCSVTLNELTLRYVNFTDETITTLQPMLSRLQKLHLNGCEWDSESVASKMFALPLIELRELSIEDIREKTLSGVDDVRITNLQSLSTGCENQTNYIEKILEANPRLKKLKLDSKFKTSQLAKQLIQRVPRIEELSLLLDHSDYFTKQKGDGPKFLDQLTALKTLDLRQYCQDKSLARLINGIAASRIPLEHLRISTHELTTELVNGIAQMKHLKSLCLAKTGKVSLTDILQIVKNRSELNSLHLRFEKLDESIFEDVIRLAPKLRNLIIHIDKCGFSFDEHLYKRILSLVAVREAKCSVQITLGSIASLHLTQPQLNTLQALLVANKGKVDIVFGCALYCRDNSVCKEHHSFL